VRTVPAHRILLKQERVMPQEHRISFERSPKRVRVMANGKTVADSLSAGLLFEIGHMPVY
jgi:uncharacterized protein (DUF427 family)